MKELTIELGERSYPIRIGAGLLSEPGSLEPWIGGSQVLLVSNGVVAPLYLDAARRALGQRDVRTLVLPDGEAAKTLESWERIHGALAAMQASRDATVVALGGGVIGDLAGFAAATWMRGCAFLQLPTTLLAQVDASVGGKTAINIPAGKNLVGAFHQPVAVIIDTDTLGTLPDRELKAGLAEVLKYGLIRDAAFCHWIADSAPALLARDPDAIGDAVERSCRHKAEIVAADERETGVRALLNLGHSFGHALEAVAGYGMLLHGEAVAIGCHCAARLSADLGMADANLPERVTSLLRALDLPTTVPIELPPGELLHAMRLDKKNRSGRIRLVLLRDLGQAELVDGVEDSAILHALEACRSPAQATANGA